ncbi:UNVERIFIED_CONTAM: hypothetical protein Scaly_3019300 [Sesamum calycinum]|uniref:PORR domain-containing protein n=1 Tax=Sesamum calycinum TaxID=2727403 RepID=A0AAW2K815_9LAMI
MRFLSLTVEKMVEVEKISHFRNWFGIDLNVKDLFLDHPGMFLSVNQRKEAHSVLEGGEAMRVLFSNLVYEARRKLLDLVLLSCRGLGRGDHKSNSVDQSEENEVEEMYND